MNSILKWQKLEHVKKKSFAIWEEKINNNPIETTHDVQSFQLIITSGMQVNMRWYMEHRVNGLYSSLINMHQHAVPLKCATKDAMKMKLPSSKDLHNLK